METWLIVAAKSLTVNIKTHLTKCYIKNILCMLIIFFKINMLPEFYKFESTGVLLRSLAVRSSSVFETEVKIFSDAYGSLFLKSIQSYINGIINFHSSSTEWIFAIPIVHYLMGQHTRLNNVEWNEDPLEFK